MATNYDSSLHLGNFTHANGKTILSDGTVFNAQTVPYVLSTTTGVDLNTTNKTNLFTVPAGKTCIIIAVYIRAPSISLTTAVFGFGFNANADDVMAAILRNELTGATLYGGDVPINGAKLGAAADVFGVKCTIAQGAAATAIIDVLGYLV